MTHLQFIEHKIPNRVTPIIEINTRMGVHKLGFIKWHGAWRKYCFFPESETIFDVSCMEEIMQKIRELMAARK